MKIFSVFFLTLVLAACSTVPEPIIRQPSTVTSPAARPQRDLNGAIYQVGYDRPLFEDIRARNVGDILTITIAEKTTAGKTDASSASKTGTISAATPTLLGLPAVTTGKLALAANNASTFSDKAAQTVSNNFTGTIGVTVVEVLPNGNLVVSGEKQMSFNTANEYVRFSGVIRPDTIAAGNVVSSTQVADARFEYRSTTKIDKAEFGSMMSRFFYSLWPM